MARMGAHWPVLGAVLFTVLISAMLAAALAALAWQAVPQAVHHELSAASGTSVLISGPLTGSQVPSDTAAVRSDMRSAFGDVPFAFDAATWSAPLGLPAAAPGPPSARASLVEAAVVDAIMTNAVLTSGQWPTAPHPGQPIPAVLPVLTASLLHVAVGDVLTLRASASGKPIPVRLTGEFRPRDPASDYWGLDLVGESGFRASGQSTTYGPLVVNPAALRGALAVVSASWLATPDTADIRDGDLGTLAAQLTQQQQLMLDSATLGELTMSTNLPALLGGMASNMVVADSLLAIGGLLLLLLDVTALSLTARLLASQRRVESAQISARGGDRWQLVRLNVTEAAGITVLAACGGVLAGGRLAGLLARTGPLRAAGLHTSPFPAAAWWAAAVTSVLCTTIVLGYALLDSPTEAWTRRQSAVTGVAKAGADVALILLAAAAVWELRRYSAVAPSASGGLTVDPVLALAPALALAAGTVLLLRLLPAAARAGDRLASRGRRLAAPLASWQISRRPVDQAGVALLVVVAVATGMLVLSQHQSWQQSVRDQSAFGAGADIRVDTPAPLSLAQDGAIATAPGVRDAMPVARLGYGDTGQAIALDASKAADVVLLRPDLSPLPAPALFGRIIPAGGPAGLAIPGRPARLVIDASLGPASLRLAAVAVTVSIQDADGDVYELPAGTLSADGRVHGLIADLAPGQRAVYPLRLLAVTLRYPLPAASSGHRAVLAVSSVAASAAASGPFGPPFASGTALGGWQAAVSSPELAGLLASPGSTAGPAMLPSAGSWRPAAAGTQALTFNPGSGRAASPGGPPGAIPAELTLIAASSGPPAIPGIATTAYLDSADVTVGSVVQISAAGALIPVRVVAAVTAFPATSGPGGAVIVDLAAMQDALALMSLAPAPVSEWWLSTSPAGRPAGPTVQLPPGLSSRLPAGSTVVLPGRLAAGILADPLSAAPQQAMLAIAVAAALLALAGFAVSITANVSQRRAQSALLSALGVSRSAQAWQLCLEQLMLSGPAAAAGLALGAVLGWLLVPAVTLTPGAAAPVPAALTEFAWSRAVPLAAAVAALPVLVAAVTVARRQDPAARMRTAEAT